MNYNYEQIVSVLKSASLLGSEVIMNTFPRCKDFENQQNTMLFFRVFAKQRIFSFSSLAQKQ